MDFKIEKKGYAPAQVNAYIDALRTQYEASLAEQKERIYLLKEQLSAAEQEIKAAKEKSSLVSRAILNAVAKAEEIERLSQLKYNQEILQLKAFHDKWTEYYNKILEKYPLDDQLAAAGRFNHQMSKILSRVGEAPSDEPTFSVSDAEKTYRKESDRLAETRIGYIKVKTEDAAPADDGALLDEMVPGADPNSPILSGNFDPLERISRYLSAEKAAVRTEDDCPPQEDPAAPDSAATDRYRSDRSASGFSFEEALHPQDDLKTIMMDLGLLMDE